MNSVLSYFSEYFHPKQQAPLWHHSAGWIARNLHAVLQEYGSVEYLDTADQPRDRQADLFVGHFWSFARQLPYNEFRSKIAVYTIANPDWTHQQLTAYADEFGAPFPSWDFPPQGFNNELTLQQADLILLLGNSSIQETFPTPYRSKIRLLNYSVQHECFNIQDSMDDRTDFCYIATQCDLRKGFMDVLQTWQHIQPEQGHLHVVGQMRPYWQDQFNTKNPGSMTYHGWIDSCGDDYSNLLNRCRYVYMPTYSEGQVGTLLEAIFCGCLPITTRMSGLDDRILEHCLVVDPRNIEQQRAVINDAAQWPDTRWRARTQRLIQAAQQILTQRNFHHSVKQAIDGCLPQRRRSIAAY